MSNSLANVYTPSRERAAELLNAIGPEKARQVLKTRSTIRAFEEKAEELYSLGKTHGTMHLSIGQEATATGASDAVHSGHDFLLNHHRGHGHCIAWGGGVDLEMARRTPALSTRRSIWPPSGICR